MPAAVFRLAIPVTAMSICHARLVFLFTPIYISSVPHLTKFQPPNLTNSSSNIDPNITMELSKHILCIALSMASLTSPSQAWSAPGLFEALNNAGASQFAIKLQTDPSILDMFIASDIATVFAPLDSVNPPKYITRQQTNATDQQELQYQLFKRLHEWDTSEDPPNQNFTSIDKNANLDGKNQSIVIKNPDSSSNGTASKAATNHRRYGEPQPTPIQRSQSHPIRHRRTVPHEIRHNQPLDPAGRVTGRLDPRCSKSFIGGDEDRNRWLPIQFLLQARATQGQQ